MRTFLESVLLSMAIITGSTVAIRSIEQNYEQMVYLLFGVLFFSYLFLLVRNHNLNNIGGNKHGNNKRSSTNL